MEGKSDIPKISKHIPNDFFETKIIGKPLEKTSGFEFLKFESEEIPLFNNKAYPEYNFFKQSEINDENYLTQKSTSMSHHEKVYNPKPNEEFNKYMISVLNAHQTETAEEYQKNVLAEAHEDPSIPDYSVAYKRLNQERNKPWKLNPSDIADFYLLEGYLSEHGGSTAYQEDPTYLAIAKAKGRVTDIGQRLLVALAHEQLDEYDRFAKVNTASVPDELRATIHEHYQERQGQTPDQETADTPRGIEQEINAYLADFNAMIEQHTTSGQTMEIFTKENTNTMFGNALRILESQQRGRWQIMAKAMRALHDTSLPMSEFVRSITATDGVGVSPEMEERLERQREPFLIDRLFNYVHNTGTMSARVTNYFPRAASLLLTHGLPGHEDYLLYHSSIGHAGDTLGKGIRHYAARAEGGNLIDDLTTVIQAKDIPREYKYAMLLEFGDERLHEAIQTSTDEHITPTRAYTLLQRVSHHDGHSRGRLKQVSK